MSLDFLKVGDGGSSPEVEFVLANALVASLRPLDRVDASQPMFDNGSFAVGATTGSRRLLLTQFDEHGFVFVQANGALARSRALQLERAFLTVDFPKPGHVGLRGNSSDVACRADGDAFVEEQLEVLLADETIVASAKGT